MKSLSIKWQTALIILALAAVMAVSLALVTISQLHEQATHELRTKAEHTSEILAACLAPSLASGDAEAIEEIVRGVLNDAHVRGLTVRDSSLAAIPALDSYTQSAPCHDTCNSACLPVIKLSGFNCQVERPVIYEGKRVGCFWMSFSEEHLAAEYEQRAKVIVSGAVILALLASFAGVWLASRMVRPIRAFEEAALRLAIGDTTATANLDTDHPDFTRLASVFRQMQRSMKSALCDMRISRERLEGDIEERTAALTSELRERREAERLAAKGQDLLRATLESTADGILVVNRDGKATHSNSRFTQLWRIPQEILDTGDDDRLLALVVDQLTDPEAFISKVRELYESQDESNDTLHFKDGRVFERYSCPLVQEGDIAGRVWSFRDITEQVRTHEKLRQSRQKLLLHFRQNPLGVIEWDLDFRVTQWNPAAERIFGHPSEEALGRHAAFILPEAVRPQIDEIWSALLSQTGGTRSTNKNVTKDGRELFCEWYNTPLVDDSGQVIGVASLVEDVTDRERSLIDQSILLQVSEAATRVDSVGELVEVVRASLSELIDTTNFYVALYDPETELYSFPYIRDEFSGSHVEPLPLKGSLTEYVRLTGRPLLIDEAGLAKMADAGEVDRVGDPTAIWLGVPLETSSGTLGVLALQDYHDETAYTEVDQNRLMSIAGHIGRVIERKQSQQQEGELREQLDRAERMRSLGVLAGGVAHDLNNMLGPLVGYPELMLAKLPPDSPIRRQVERISHSARQAAEVVQDLLTLARRGRYNMVPTDFNAVVEDYCDSPGLALLSETHPEVQIDIALDPRIEPVMGSAPHLNKIVMNLVVNAFDAMPSGGRLEISSSQGQLDSLIGGYNDIVPNEYVILRVKDTGMGIAADDVDKIFEPYYSKKKMGTSGSGLGLAVVYGVIKDHKGYYDILSEPGQGTEFIVYLPVSEVPKELADTENSCLEGKESILIVDDDDCLREMAGELIGSLGYRVNRVTNGHEAVEYLKKNSADLVVLDMIMEKGFDGLDTFREIIKIRSNQRVIIVSGYSSTDRVVEMQRLGAGEYVKKPYTRQAIGNAIRSELDRGRASAATATT